jgi:hypothetical protein
MHKKWLKVPRGQLTFDAEGKDIIGHSSFTRTPHVPNKRGTVIGSSGVTYGRGLDIGSLSGHEVQQRFAKMAEYAEQQ